MIHQRNNNNNNTLHQDHKSNQINLPSAGINSMKLLFNLERISNNFVIVNQILQCGGVTLRTIMAIFLFFISSLQTCMKSLFKIFK